MRIWPALELGSALDDLLQAALIDHDIVAVDETASDAPRVFFRSAAGRDRAAASLRNQFPRLALAGIDVPDDDWAKRSQASLRSVRVGGIAVSPPWDVDRSHEVLRQQDPLGHGFSSALTIVIEPSMGFGTGHHATTRLCLAAMQTIDLRCRQVLDVGTGSGVLAIAASLLGAAGVVAVDDDADAIRSATQNVSLNPAARVELVMADLRMSDLSVTDVVLANLTGGLLVRHASRLTQLAAIGGRLILSGFTDSEEHNVLAAFESLAFERRAHEDEWVCVTLART
jgi:ribosomal protein L11 methyltransferase